MSVDKKYKDLIMKDKIEEEELDLGMIKAPTREEVKRLRGQHVRERDIRLDAIEEMMVRGYTPRAIIKYYKNQGYSRTTIKRDIDEIYRERFVPEREEKMAELRQLRAEQLSEILKELLEEGSVGALAAAKSTVVELSKLEGSYEENKQTTEFTFKF